VGGRVVQRQTAKKKVKRTQIKRLGGGRRTKVEKRSPGGAKAGSGPRQKNASAKDENEEGDFYKHVKTKFCSSGAKRRLAELE